MMMCCAAVWTIRVMFALSSIRYISDDFRCLPLNRIVCFVFFLCFVLFCKSWITSVQFQETSKTWEPKICPCNVIILHVPILHLGGSWHDPAYAWFQCLLCTDIKAFFSVWNSSQWKWQHVAGKRPSGKGCKIAEEGGWCLETTESVFSYQWEDLQLLCSVPSCTGRNFKVN